MSKNSVVDVKVYLTTSDIKRFCASSYEDLCLKLQRICSVDIPSIVADSAASDEKKNEVKVEYIDDESEWVSLSSENEWIEAILHREGESALKIRVSSDVVKRFWKGGHHGFGRHRGGGRGRRSRRGRRGRRGGRGRSCRRFQVPHGGGGGGFGARLPQRIRRLRQRCRRLRMRLNKVSRANHPQKAKNLRARLQRLRCRLLMMTTLHQRHSGSGCGGFCLTQQWKKFAPEVEVENPRKMKKKEFGARCERRGRKNRHGHRQFRETQFGSRKHRGGGGLGVRLPMRMRRVRERVRRLHLRIQRTEDPQEKKMLRRRLQRLKSRLVMMRFLRHRQGQRKQKQIGFRGGRGRGGRGRKLFAFRFDGCEEADFVGNRMGFAGRRQEGWKKGQRFQKWKGNRFGRAQSMGRLRRRRGGNEWRRGFEEI